MPAKRRNKDDLWVPTIKRPKEIGSLLSGVGLGLSFLQISDLKALSITLDWVMRPALCQAALGTKLPRPDSPCLEMPTTARPAGEDVLRHFPALCINNHESIQNRRRLSRSKAKS
jgi:hypothetical protein